MSAYNKYLLFFGFLAPIPLFIIPTFPFIYINIINEDPIWMITQIVPYTGYTGSLGMAAPLILLSITLSFLTIIKSEHFEIKKDLVLSFCVLFIFAIIVSLLSQSIKMLGPISSFAAFMMLSHIYRSSLSESFFSGFIVSLSFFSIFHAISMIYNGLMFSLYSEGVSFYGIEIYQALVSYTALLSFFFGTLVLNPNLLNDVGIYIKNTIVRNLFYIIVLSSLILNIAILSRRLSLLLCFFAMIIFLIKKIMEKGSLKNNKLIGFVTMTLIFFAFFANKIFTGAKSINYLNMIKPRLDGYIEKVDIFSNSSFSQIIFGEANGWARIENGFLDIALNTGFFGLLCFAFIFFYYSRVWYLYFSKDLTIYKRGYIYIYYSLTVLFIDNFVNNAISTPYYFASFLILFSVSLRSLSK